MTEPAAPERPAHTEGKACGQQEKACADRRVLLQTEISGDLVFVNRECQVAVFLFFPGYGQGAARVQVAAACIVGEKFQAVFALDIARGNLQCVDGGSVRNDLIQLKLIRVLISSTIPERKTVVVIDDSSVFICDTDCEGRLVVGAYGVDYLMEIG